jgi:hypothetical protein
MSLFSFANISFGSKNRSVGNDIQNLGAKFGYNIYRYPIDLGSSDKGHYMMFHVNEQRMTSYASKAMDDKPTVLENRENFKLGTPYNFAYSKIEKDPQKSLAFVRTIRRVADTVALYMPDTLVFTQNQSYSEQSLTGGLAAGGSILSEGASFVDNINQKDLKGIFNNLSPGLATYLKGKSQLLSAGFTAYTGLVVNPLLEIIYSSPNLREFRFDFMFYPRNENEAKEVQNIINRFHFHQAPEVNLQGQGFFLVPPSEFDILFYYNGKINPNIPKISTCVLTSIDVNYAPNGFAAYEVQGNLSPEPGETGMPVAITMSLNFKETEIVTKSNFGMVPTVQPSQTTSETGVVGTAKPIGGAGGFIPNNPAVNPSTLRTFGNDTGIPGIENSTTPIIIG